MKRKYADTKYWILKKKRHEKDDDKDLFTGKLSSQHKIIYLLTYLNFEIPYLIADLVMMKCHYYYTLDEWLCSNEVIDTSYQNHEEVKIHNVIESEDIKQSSNHEGMKINNNVIDKEAINQVLRCSESHVYSSDEFLTDEFSSEESLTNDFPSDEFPSDESLLSEKEAEPTDLHVDIIVETPPKTSESRIPELNEKKENENVMDSRTAVAQELVVVSRDRCVKINNTEEAKLEWEKEKWKRIMEENNKSRHHELKMLKLTVQKRQLDFEILKYKRNNL
jgi:hypothetical protein